MKHERLTSDEISKWLVYDGFDEEYAEALVLTYINWKYNLLKTTSELTKEDMLTADTQAIANMVKQTLDEILFSKEIDAYAWWKKED